MSTERPLNIVTGAFGFSGKYITRLLLERGERVRTLTNHPDARSPLGSQIEVAPLDFASETALARSMEGAAVLYNTYWVRFAHGHLTHANAVQNTKTLIHAAESAGVRRIIHVSITHPSLTSNLPYFRGKAELEEAIKTSSLSYAILRPAVLFGGEDILINNIAFLLRRAPLFAIPGDGNYRVQPIFGEDFASLAVEHGHHIENEILDAVGPETYTYNDLVQRIRTSVGSTSRAIHVSPSLLLFASRVLGLFLNDVILTRDEIDGLMADLLVSPAPATGTTRLSEWLEAHANQVGMKYASELARHYETK
jgi:uncharacterized protein YbjT (DUF2867 family)